MVSSCDALNRAELVVDLFDAHRSDGGAGERAEKDAPEGVAEGDAVAVLERFGDEPAVAFGFVVDVQLRGDVARGVGHEFHAVQHSEMCVRSRDKSPVSASSTR